MFSVRSNIVKNETYSYLADFCKSLLPDNISDALGRGDDNYLSSRMFRADDKRFFKLKVPSTDVSTPYSDMMKAFSMLNQVLVSIGTDGYHEFLKHYGLDNEEYRQLQAAYKEHFKRMTILEVVICLERKKHDPAMTVAQLINILRPDLDGGIYLRYQNALARSPSTADQPRPYTGGASGAQGCC